MDRLCGAFIRLGVRKLRITGGEPLVRRDVMTLFRSLGARLGQGLEELTLTTNGTQLTRMAPELYAAGVRRVNVSLDTLSAETFARITRWGRIEKTLAGIRAARQAGLAVKVNAVALKGVNEDEIDDMLAWCGREGLDLTLIETMPMGDVAGPRRPVPAAVRGARPVAAALDADRDGLPHRRPGPLLRRRGDRQADRVHHPDDA